MVDLPDDADPRLKRLVEHIFPLSEALAETLQETCGEGPTVRFAMVIWSDEPGPWMTYAGNTDDRLATAQHLRAMAANIEQSVKAEAKGAGYAH